MRTAANKAEAERLIADKRYLDAAQVIRDDVPDAEHDKFVRDTFLVPNFKQSGIHEVALQLDPKMVVTTNYDDVYDQFCRTGKARDGYNVVRYYDPHILDNVRSTTRVIIKAHGCVTDPARTVLTRSQYFRARRDNGAFYSILDALFLTNTILFVGCGLDDPDIQLILENVNISVASAHPHYALTAKGRHASLIRVIKETYNIELLEYETAPPPNPHAPALEALKDLCAQVQAHRALPT